MLQNFQLQPSTYISMPVMLQQSITEHILIQHFVTHNGSNDNILKLENCTLLAYYAASSDDFLLTFQDNLLFPSPRVKYTYFWILDP